MRLEDPIIRLIQSMLSLTLLLTLIAGLAIAYVIADPSLGALKDAEENTVTDAMPTSSEIENGIHVATGLVEGEGMQAVISNCLTCHSAKLITQNKMNRDRWLSTIRWMQETQNLRDLGDQEEPILQYLSKFYAPEEVGRRKVLTNIEWYELKE
ncbi:MAG: monoheme cytochrome C [Bacteroidota bacterium]